MTLTHTTQRTFLLVCFVFAISFNLLGQDTIKERTIIDVTHVDWQSTKPLKIEGYFDFYWKKFINPEDSIFLQADNLAKVPGVWSKLSMANGTKLSADGYGTYQIKLVVPNKTEVYGLKMYSVFSAFKLWQNSKLLVEVGTLGKIKAESNPDFETLEIPIVVNEISDATHQDIILTFQVSNFFHRRAGLQKPMYFATMDKILGQTKDALVLNLLLIGIILVIGLNHVLMYLLRRLDISNLMFGLLCVIMILRNLSTGERILLHWFPNMDWELLVRLDNFSGFATIALVAFFFYYQFRKEFPKVMLYIIMGIGFVVTLLVFISKAWFYGQFRMVFELYILFGGLYLTFGVLLRSAIKGRDGALVSFVGMFLLYATAINDVLSSMGVIDTAFLAPYGLATFLMFQSFLLTRKSAIALKNNQKLSVELETEKELLESRINERTKELTSQANELGAHKLKQEEQNWISESVNQINEEMRKNKDNLEMLADQLLSILVKRVSGNLGALYFLNNDHLKLLASYGLSDDLKEVEMGTKEGITGKVFSDAKAMYLDDLPENYFDISSGLGGAKPKSIAVIPMIVDEKVTGVVEVASFKTLSNIHRGFLERSMVIIASQLSILKLNAETKTLVEDYKNQEQEFREAQMELIVLRERLDIATED